MTMKALPADSLEGVPTVSRLKGEHPTMMTELTGEQPCYVMHDDALWIEHDCRTRRISTLVDTHSWFGWQIVAHLVLTDGTEALVLDHKVTCTGCHVDLGTMFTQKGAV